MADFTNLIRNTLRRRPILLTIIERPDTATLRAVRRVLAVVTVTVLTGTAPLTASAQQVGAPLTEYQQDVNAPIYPNGQVPDDLVAIMDAPASNAEAIPLSQLKNPNSDFYQRRRVFSVSSGRATVIEAAARGVGIRGGFAYEAERINRLLMGKFRSRIERHYQFKPLMLQDGYVVPPVITKINNVREQSGPNFLYLNSGSYEVTREPRLTTQTPSWMDWLLLPLRGVRPPENIQLKSADEKQVWAAAVEDAWATGVREARLSFNTGLATLHRDYNGMKMYHALAQQGALSIPKIDVRKVGWRVTEDGKRAFANEVAIEIKVGPKFKGKRK